MKTSLTDEDGEARELTERDFAYAKRRDGSIAFPKLHARYRLAELRDVLATVRTEDKARLNSVLLAMSDLEKLLASDAERVAREAAE